MLTQYSQVENANQLLTFGMAILFGGILCFAYDCYRTMLSQLKAPSFLKHCADIVYCILGALACFCFLLVFSKGEIRIYALLGFVIGFLVIRRFFSKYIRILITKLLKAITALVTLLFRPATRGILWCYKKIAPFLVKLPKTIQLFSKNKEKSLENDNPYDV